MEIKKFNKGQTITGYLFIKSLSINNAANGSRYFNLKLTDENYDEIDSKMWNIQPEDEEEYKAGQLIKIKGNVQEFKNHLQLILNKIRLTNEGDDVNINDFVPSAPESIEGMLKDLEDTIKTFDNTDLQKITQALLESKKTVLSYFPAAMRMHHAVKGGLLYHTWSMLQMALKIVPLYSFLNPELVYAGVILHDFGKTEEMLSDQNGSINDYSKEGKLLGHIVTEVVEIDRFAEKLNIDPEVTLMLKHMILSHHYEADYGSPKRPMFPEAELLHYLDVIDARMNTMEHIENALKPGDFSERIWGLDKIQLYKSTL